MIRAEDFASWLVEGLKWNWGLIASYHDKPVTRLTASNGIPMTSLLSSSKLDLSEIDMEKEKGLITLSFLLIIDRNSVKCEYQVHNKRN